MKIKHLIIVSLMLAILTIGAVSASDDIVAYDDLAVEEVNDDSIVEIEDSNDEEIITSNSNEDILDSEYYDNGIRCTVYEDIVADDANGTYELVDCYVYASGYSNGENVRFLVIVDDILYSFERTMENNNRYFYITNKMLGIHEFRDYKISVYFESDKTGMFFVSSQVVHFSSYPFNFKATNVYNGEYYPYGVKIYYQISLPANATGKLTLTVNGKTYDVNYKDGLGSVYVDTVGWNLGNYTASARYEGNGEYHPSYREVTVEIIPKIMLPTIVATGFIEQMGVGENESITIMAPSNLSGEVMILVRDSREVPIAHYDLEISNGYVSYSLANLSEGKYFFEITGYVGNYSINRNFNISVINVSDEYSSSMLSTEIFEGDNAYLRISKPFEAFLFISVDDVPLKIYATNAEIYEAISGLGVGIHKIKIMGQADTDYYSNTFMVTVKERPAPEPAPTPVKDTVKLTLKKAKVRTSAKKLVLTATLKINGKAKKDLVVKFKFNKKTYKVKTDANGVAKVTIKKSVLKKLKAGKKITYQASYDNTVKKITVKVLK